MSHTEQVSPKITTETVNVDVKVHEKRSTLHRARKLGKYAAIGAGVIALGGGLLSQCGGGVGTKRQATVPHANVFSIKPIGVDFRAMTKADIVATANKTFGTPVDHVPAVGLVTRAAEHTVRDTSIFTGANGKNGGEVDTLIGVKAAEVKVVPQADGAQTIYIPTKDVVEFSAINETNATIIRNDGDLAALGQFEWSIIGGLLPGERTKVELGRGALDAVARAEAINVAQTTCATSAWTEEKLAIQDAYREIGQKEYSDAVAQGARLQPYDPNKTTVVFVGPTPTFEAPYKLPPHTNVSSGHGKEPIHCTVTAGAYEPVQSYVNAANESMPTSINDF